ncbi:hypothetical protein XPA_009601 [Xanthoria parietina]
MMSEDCHFCASIVSEPAEQEAIVQDMHRSISDVAPAAITKLGPFWEIQAFHCYYCVETQRLPLNTAEHNLRARKIFTHEDMMEMIKR